VMTILTGSEADELDTARLVAHLADNHPNVEVSVVPGGQPLYTYMFGAE
jgi:uncharacterized protein